jgi:sec-independent protein translocase protein TatB
MFDFGFWEILLIVVVALVVVGPERLPGLARTTGLWVGKARRFISDVKSEIDQELAADELKKIMDKQNLLNDVYEVIEETKQAGQELKKEFQSSVDSATESGNASSPELPDALNKKSAELGSETSTSNESPSESPDSVSKKPAEKVDAE